MKTVDSTIRTLRSSSQPAKPATRRTVGFRAAGTRLPSRTPAPGEEAEGRVVGVVVMSVSLPGRACGRGCGRPAGGLPCVVGLLCIVGGQVQEDVVQRGRRDRQVVGQSLGEQVTGEAIG